MHIKVGSMYLETFDVNASQIQYNFIDNFIFTTIREHACTFKTEADVKEMITIIAEQLNISLYDIYIVDKEYKELNEIMDGE